MKDVEWSLLLAALGTPELARGLATVAATWPLDPDGLPARRPGARGWLVHAYRRVVHRFVWWLHRDQLQSIASFHGLLNHSLQYLARAVAEGEKVRRAERAALEVRIAALEARLEVGDSAAPAPSGVDEAPR